MKKGVATLCFLLVLVGSFMAGAVYVKAQSTDIYISSDGAVVGTDNIQRSGDLYVLTGNISGSIAVQKSNITIDGAGYTIEGYGGTGIDLSNNLTEYPSPNSIRNVTIENLRIMNFNFSIDTRGSIGNTFYNNYIGNTTNNVQGGIYLYWGSDGNNITRCTIMGTVGIELSNGNTVTENNLLGGMFLRLCGNETVDRNYWSDYATRYPNATEIGSSDIGNTPYVLSDIWPSATKQPLNSDSDLGGVHQDNHPLIKQVAIPLTGSSPGSTIPEFPASIILPLLIAIFFIAVKFCYRNPKASRQPSEEMAKTSE
jgi:hypothetical protein